MVGWWNHRRVVRSRRHFSPPLPLSPSKFFSHHVPNSRRVSTAAARIAASGELRPVMAALR